MQRFAKSAVKGFHQMPNELLIKNSIGTPVKPVSAAGSAKQTY